jgi:hypothetical protein
MTFHETKQWKIKTQFYQDSGLTVKNILSFLFSVQFCGMSTSEHPFLRF